MPPQRLCDGGPPALAGEPAEPAPVRWEEHQGLTFDIDWLAEFVRERIIAQKSERSTSALNTGRNMSRPTPNVHLTAFNSLQQPSNAFNSLKSI